MPRIIPRSPAGTLVRDIDYFSDRELTEWVKTAPLEVFGYEIMESHWLPDKKLDFSTHHAFSFPLVVEDQILCKVIQYKELLSQMVIAQRYVVDEMTFL